MFRSHAAYDKSRVEVGLIPGDDPVWKAVYRLLREDLGQSESMASKRATLETTGDIARGACDDIERSGLSFLGKRVLDLGAGLGGLSVEMARRGAHVVAIEPATAWRKLAAQRLAGMMNVAVIGATGEHLPLADNSIDLIVSRQVLEHVADPHLVIREAFRVLKPGGYISITYENYLSFWEPHYRIPWFPMLPKPIGAAYLRAIGRDPSFLREAITYTTFPAVRRTFFKAGFACIRLRDQRDSIHSPLKTSIKWKVLKSIASVSESTAVCVLSTSDYFRRAFRTTVHEVMRKQLS